MTLLDRLQAHRGGLVRIKSGLFWYGGRGWDRVPGRLCLVLDVATNKDLPADALIDARTDRGAAAFTALVAALLLVDGAPHWVWVNEESVELLDGGDQ